MIKRGESPWLGRPCQAESHGSRPRRNQTCKRTEIAAMTDPFNLKRFVDAQNEVFVEVLAELLAGRKRSHWMWFIFPQMKGLGSSAQANFYGIGSFDEAT